MAQGGVSYLREQNLSAEEFLDVLGASGLGSIRPGDLERLGRMLAGANLIVTARKEGKLLGVARCVTDFSWVCYLSDLAVSRGAQGLGVGKSLIDAVRHEIGPEVALCLVSVPESTGFYDRIGMRRVNECYWISRER